MKRLLLLSVSLCLFVACKAQNTDKNQQSLLWKISKKGQKDSYVLGTMHLLCADDYVWTDAMAAKLKAADVVCFEMDLDNPNLMSEVMSGLQGMGSEEESKSLKEYLSAEDFKRLKTFAKDSLGMSPLLLDNMPPFLLQTMFLTKMLDCPLPMSYEGNIMTEAQRQGKEIIGLETADEQLAALSETGDDSMAAGLMQFVDSFSASRQNFREMIALFKNQDVEKLAGMTNEPGGNGGLNMQALLQDRNKKWIARMADKMSWQSVFFAVGAAHLGGKEGVLRLLRQAGYTVSAVR